MFNVKFGYNFWLKYLIERHLIFSNVTTSASLLGTRSKSQDAIRNHRKTVRFVSDKQEYQPILDSTTMGMGCNSRPNNRGGGGGSELGQTGRGRSFFLLSMLQGGDPSSSNGRPKNSKVRFDFSILTFSMRYQNPIVGKVVKKRISFISKN